MSAESVILDLVGSVYDAANDPQLWPVFLEGFAEVAHATSTSIFFYDLANLSASMFHSVRSDSEWWGEYSAHYAEVDPWAAGGFRLGLGSGDVATGEMLCPNETLTRSAFANDFLLKGGVFHECCGIVFREPLGASVISCLRPKRFGPFGDDQTRLLQLIKGDRIPLGMEPEPMPIRRSWAWIATACVLALVFIAVLGPGVRFTSKP
jgi:hypothetical protein